jgi:hypothetical protein
MDDAPDMDWGALEPIEQPAPPAVPPPPPPPEPEILPPAPEGPIAPNLNPLGLTEEEARFARTFVEKGSLAAAARAAGLEGGSSMGRKVLDRPHVAAEVARLAIDKGQDLVVDEPLTISTDQVISALFEISTASILDAYEQDADGNIAVKRIDSLPANLKAAVKSVKQDAKGKITIELYSKMDALKMLMSFFEQRTRKAPPKLQDPDADGGELVSRRESVTITQTRTLTFDSLVQQHGAAISRSLGGA